MDEAEQALAGGGEMGALMRSIDWSQTPLGPVSGWSPALRTTVSTMLASPYPIALYWGEEYVVLYNDSFRPIFGAKHPASMGAPAAQVLSEAWSILGPMLVQVRSSKVASYAQDKIIFLERQGFVEECFFTWSYIPVHDESGRLVGIVVLVSETTRQMLTERRMKRMRELSIRTAVEKSVEGIFRAVQSELSHAIADLPFSLLYRVDKAASPRAQLVACTGLEPGSAAAPESLSLEEEPVWPIREVVHSGQERLLEDVGERFGTLNVGPWPEPVSRVLLLPLSWEGSGETTAVLVAGLSPRLPLNEEYHGFLQLLSRQVAADVARVQAYEAERRRAEQLEALDRAKTAFFSNVSHEFRTPLTLMLAPVEDALADREEVLAPRQRERLSLVQRNGARLLKLVNSLLDYSRLEAGRAKVAYQATDLPAFTAELVSHFESAMHRAGLVLTVAMEPLAGPVWVDREAWEKVVFNLLSNALKYTLEGDIEVSLREEGAEAVLRVRDTGTGIPAEALPHVFERFHRVEGTWARSHEGSGIGLSLVQELVKLHGGSASVHSVLGQGSTFTVRLPLGKDHLPPEHVLTGGTEEAARGQVAPYLDEAMGWLRESAPPAPPVLSRPRARVLVVDDNADMRAYIVGLLQPSFAVEAVADGVKALEFLREQTPDLILSDVMMPRLGGFGLLREVRAKAEWKAVPFIMLSARTGEEASVEGFEAGADDYLVKPFSARELLARVRSSLEMARLRREAAVREASELTLQEAVHARDDFLSVASHELKTPLAALRLQTEALERILPPEVRARVGERFFAVRRQTQRLAGLIETMLDISLVATGRLQLKPEPLDLAGLVADGVAQLREEMARRGCSLTLESEASLPGKLDAMRMGQLVQNLLSNAIKYGAGKPVEVRLRQKGNVARLEVVDHGIGVAPENRARIFHRFERAVPVRHYGGLGLGLWVSRQVVEAHGGSISVTDTPGGGATFTVELPLDAPPLKASGQA
ncbi:ATP-binding protein [Stigmatella aurantiaca]|uniref:histidine kinase n=1 Tax=Stigmatella aurantiaca (strain DW4/3-1) TaxID=378806 RepID=Q08X84_STIAD|nr:ATP-binding protein [Stigmatella aurantiaca]ADO75899.1 Sensor protein [Stigmatella aurantiaca DW4/3-1]EAU65085.1 two-component hybrid sensor and regulator [Stigmatella aurantiaca DW4/3-1]